MEDTLWCRGKEVGYRVVFVQGLLERPIAGILVSSETQARLQKTGGDRWL